MLNFLPLGYVSNLFVSRLLFFLFEEGCWALLVFETKCHILRSFLDIITFLLEYGLHFPVSSHV